MIVRHAHARRLERVADERVLRIGVFAEVNAPQRVVGLEEPTEVCVKHLGVAVHAVDAVVVERDAAE